MTFGMMFVFLLIVVMVSVMMSVVVVEQRLSGFLAHQLPRTVPPPSAPVSRPADEADDDRPVFEMGDRVLVCTGDDGLDIWVRGEFVGLRERVMGRVNGDLVMEWRALVRLRGATGGSEVVVEVPPRRVDHDDGVEVVLGYRDSAKDVN